MKSIYIVTGGSYSAAYRIYAVFDSKELAQAFIDSFAHPFDGFNIEEWDLNPHELHLKAGLKSFWVQMKRTGALIKCDSPTSDYEFGEGEAVYFGNKNSFINVFCFANDETHAIKIANEKRTELIALNKW